MNTILVLILYAAVAALVTSYTFYHGVIDRARPTVFGFADYTILLITAVAVGAAWALFVPTLVYAGGVRARRHVAARPRSWALQWPVHLRALR